MLLDLVSLGLISKICINTIMLENISYFTLFYIEHPVPIELKLLHFRNTLSLSLESIAREEILNIFEKISIDMKDILNQIVNDIKELNAIEITDYIHKILNNMVQKSDNVRSLHLTVSV